MNKRMNKKNKKRWSSPLEKGLVLPGKVCRCIDEVPPFMPDDGGGGEMRGQVYAHAGGDYLGTKPKHYILLRKKQENNTNLIVNFWY